MRFRSPHLTEMLLAMRFIRSLFAVLVLPLCCPGLVYAAPLKVDLLLKGGTIVDGTGKGPVQGDVAVRGDLIVAVGEVGDVEPVRTIECQGLVVCPGFIDLHNHSDASILAP